MRSLRALAVYIVVVFLGGALLAPCLCWLAQSFAPVFPGIAASPFHRFVSRALFGMALLALWPLLKSLGDVSPHDVGLVKPAGQWKMLAGGFLLGFVSLAVVAGFAFAGGARHLNENVSRLQLGHKLAGAALTAVVVAVVEEFLFRGVLFGFLRKVFHWVFALVLSSMIYAIAHFLEGAKTVEPVTWYAGMTFLLRMLRGFTDWHAIVPGFFNLTLAGALLGLACQRTGNLYCSIGLHAGWVFWLKFYALLSREVPGACTWWWGTGKTVNGWAALPVLAVTLLIFARFPAARRPGLRP